MNLNISAWSINNPIPSVMLFVLLTLGGLVSFKALNVQDIPDMNLPAITIVCSLPGASPAQLETEVARKIENAIATVQGLKHITTKIQQGNVSSMAEFRMDKPVQAALNDVRSAVSMIRANLPSAMHDPVINKLDVSGGTILAYSVNSANPAYADDQTLSSFVDNTVTRRLLKLDGVGSANRVGGVDREISVALTPLTLRSLGITAADISNQLEQILGESSGGRTDLGDGEQAIRTMADIGSVEQLRALELSLPGGRRMRLGELAQVEDTVAEIRSIALLNGKPVVGFEIAASKGSNQITVAREVKAALAELQTLYPDMRFSETFNLVAPVKQSFDGSMEMLYDGALLAVLVVWLFLKNFRATLISACALPLSIIPAFLGMHYFGFSLNVVTLLALSLVIGILVDDTIVEVENIMRHLRKGISPYEAAKEAAAEIGMAVIATTLTLVAVFLPTAFMGGSAGLFFRQFGITATIAILASLAVARLITPMMAAYLLNITSDRDQSDGPIKHAYMKAVAWCLKHRLITMGGASLFFIGSLALTSLLPSELMPEDNDPQTQVSVELPPGVSLEQTRNTAEAARRLVAEVPYVESVYTTIGGGSAGNNPAALQGVEGVNKATLTILLASKNRSVLKSVTEKSISKALQALPGARTNVGLAGGSDKYVLKLTGDHPQVLISAANTVIKQLRTVPGFGTVTSSAALVRPEIVVRPDFAKAAELGVTTDDIGETLRISTVGDYPTTAPKFNLAQRQIPISVKLVPEARRNLSVLEQLAVPSSKPEIGTVTIGEIAQFKYSGSQSTINRYDRSRYIDLNIQLAGLTLGAAAKTVNDLPSVGNLPQGVKQVGTGDAEEMQELFDSFGIAMMAGILCIYCVLVLLFKDFLQPITILAALPLSFGGSFIALLITGKSLSMPSLIGLLMLMGIATKNSILLVEYAIVARRKLGCDRIAALLDACHKRVRPIVMTSVAMAAGMLPIAIGTATADSTFRSPMAIAVIGGLATSTLLSLFVIPVVYTYADDFEGLMRRVFRKNSNTKPKSDASKTR